LDSILPVKETYEVINDVSSKVYEGLSLVFPAIPGWVEGKRAERLINTCKIVQNKLDNCNLPKEQIRHCSLKLGVPWVENASLEEDPSLQELWANLLTNANNPNFDSEDIYISFISIIKDLSTIDVQVIKFLQSKIQLKTQTSYNTSSKGNDIDELTKNLEINRNKIATSFQNLKRLYLINNIYNVNMPGPIKSIWLGPDEDPNKALTDLQNESNKAMSEGESYYFTELGLAFIKACVDDAGNNKAKSSE